MIIDTKLPAGMTLLPCPFCGGTAQIEPDGDGCFIACLNKDCLVVPITLYFRTKHDAIRAWNRRSVADPLDPIIPVGGKLRIVNGTTI